jgi:hypothetical protein
LQVNKCFNNNDDDSDAGGGDYHDDDDDYNYDYDVNYLHVITILAKLRAEAAKLQVCIYINIISTYHIYPSSNYYLIRSNIYVLYKTFQQQIIDCGLEEVFKSFDTDNDGKCLCK